MMRRHRGFAKEGADLGDSLQEAKVARKTREQETKEAARLKGPVYGLASCWPTLPASWVNGMRSHGWAARLQLQGQAWMLEPQGSKLKWQRSTAFAFQSRIFSECCWFSRAVGWRDSSLLVPFAAQRLFFLNLHIS